MWLWGRRSTSESMELIISRDISADSSTTDKKKRKDK